MLSDLGGLRLWKAADRSLISLEVRSLVRELPPLDVVLSRRQPTTPPKGMSEMQSATKRLNLANS